MLFRTTIATLGLILVCAPQLACEPSCEDNLTCNDYPHSGGGGSEVGGGDAGGAGGAGGQGAQGGGGQLTSVIQVVGGRAHTCALLGNEAKVRCWGDNEHGQLGDGTMLDSPTPVDVMSSSQVVRISAGFLNGCQITASGASCWGANNKGQVAGVESGNDVLIPQFLSLPGPIKNVANGQDHSCAILENGDPYCWGDNFAGQLGTSGQIGPFQVATLANIDILGAGLAHTCAQGTSGVSCWGLNDDGQIGSGSTAPVVSTPAAITLGSVVDICGGGSVSCAVLSGGGVRCWGNTATVDYGNTPAVVTGVSQATAIACGDGHICAVTADKSLGCWGVNEYGEAGHPGVGTATPQKVLTLASGIEHVTAGDDHTCSLLSDGTVWCWGRNTDGQLGDGTFDSSATPVQVMF